jgi:Lrp/AsnC family transcriptional regulator for asnA, asnC and gidA
MVRISNIDLITKLQENSKISYVALAKMFNVTETAIRKRIKNLEEKNIIKGYNVILDIKKLGYELSAIIGIDTLPEHYMRIIALIKQDKEVINAYTSSGDHMLMIEKYFKNHKELEECIKKLEGIQGITKVCPAIIIEKIK